MIHNFQQSCLSFKCLCLSRKLGGRFTFLSFLLRRNLRLQTDFPTRRHNEPGAARLPLARRRPGGAAADRGSEPGDSGHQPVLPGGPRAGQGNLREGGPGHPQDPR